MARYYHVSDDEPIRPRMKGWRFKCCDCALVHVIDLRVVGKKVEMRLRRDHRATASARKRKFGV